MKDKILMLIIGILIGAIITAGAFFIYNKNRPEFENERRMPNFESEEFSKKAKMPNAQNNNNIENTVDETIVE